MLGVNVVNRANKTGKIVYFNELELKIQVQYDDGSKSPEYKYPLVFETGFLSTEDVQFRQEIQELLDSINNQKNEVRQLCDQVLSLVQKTKDIADNAENETDISIIASSLQRALDYMEEAEELFSEAEELKLELLKYEANGSSPDDEIMIVLRDTNSQIMHINQRIERMLHHKNVPAPIMQIPTRFGLQMSSWTPGRPLAIGNSFRRIVDALNDVFHKDYSGYQRGACAINDEFFTWFPHLSGRERNKEFVNILNADHTIIEEFYPDHRSINPVIEDRKRLVFAKEDAKSYYVFIGVFKAINVDVVDKKVTYERIDCAFDPAILD